MVENAGARVCSADLDGVGAISVPIVVRAVPGLPGFDVEGLSETTAREVRVRLKSAFAYEGSVLLDQRFHVEVQAGHKAKGSHWDLPIAIALAAAILGIEVPDYLILGELSLSGKVRPVRGVLSMVAMANKPVIYPADNHAEMAYAKVPLHPVSTLHEAIEVVSGSADRIEQATCNHPREVSTRRDPDMKHVIGQSQVVRGLIAAAVTGRNVLMVGPPGSGKTMLARRFPTILPELTEVEQVEVAKIYSAAGLRVTKPMDRPFRAPHHTASAAALVGGGDPIRPGEMSLAHRGVLFLDELPEFRRDAFDAMSRVIHEGVSTVARVRRRVVMPASPIVIGAMNPCPCGYRRDARKLCSCSEDRIQSYWRRVEGFLDAMNPIRIQVKRIPLRMLREKEERLPPTPSSAALQKEVMRVRSHHRPTSLDGFAPDAKLELDEIAGSPGATRFTALLEVARTLATLDATNVQRMHVQEAQALTNPLGETVGGS